MAQGHKTADLGQMTCLSVAQNVIRLLSLLLSLAYGVLFVTSHSGPQTGIYCLVYARQMKTRSWNNKWKNGGIKVLIYRKFTIYSYQLNIQLVSAIRPSSTCNMFWQSSYLATPDQFWPDEIYEAKDLWANWVYTQAFDFRWCNGWLCF